ncbi:glycosyltransferase family 4 protein [Nitrospira sp. Ecomares 2.1]
MGMRKVKRLKVLISAYACEPGKGSESGVGWNVALQMAKYHDVWVITRINNRSSIEAALEQYDQPKPHFLFYDLPRWMRFWKKGGRGVRAYYYMWQMGILVLIRRLHRTMTFELIHHVTFVRFWTPSFLSFLPIPFLWGPIGGGDTTPKVLRNQLDFRSKLYETGRHLALWIGEHDPFVWRTAARSRMGIATTKGTANRLKRLGVSNVKVYGEAGLEKSAIAQLSQSSQRSDSSFRFVTIGRLLGFKGVFFALRAFAHANIPHCEYWIIGDGPDKRRLERLVVSLGIAERVKFFGEIPRSEALRKLVECNVLVHPSFHESGGWVCLEAMAAARPVICLDHSGPATQVTDETGILIAVNSAEQVLRDMGESMKRLAGAPSLCEQMGRAGRERVLQDYSWDSKVDVLNEFYQEVAFQGTS